MGWQAWIQSVSCLYKSQSFKERWERQDQCWGSNRHYNLGTLYLRYRDHCISWLVFFFFRSLFSFFLSFSLPLFHSLSFHGINYKKIFQLWTQKRMNHVINLSTSIVGTWDASGKLWHVMTTTTVGTGLMKWAVVGFFNTQNLLTNLKIS